MVLPKCIAVFVTSTIVFWLYLCGIEGSKAANNGVPEVKGRANFMHGEGYVHGPVDIEIQGYGFTAEGPHGAEKRSTLQSHR